MAARSFLVLELARTQAGNFAEKEQGTRFEWTRENRAAPHDGWPFGGKMRTVREDYPGATEPEEQVLGHAWQPFTLRGEWDDRYAGDGFAEKTRKEWEAFIQRGSMARFSFEGVSIDGIITEWNINYRRKWLQGYSFTVSPHRRPGESRPAPQQSAQSKGSPVQVWRQVTDYASVLSALTDAPPRSLVRIELRDDLRTLTADIAARALTVGNILSSRVLVKRDQTSSTGLERTVHALVGVRDKAREIPELLSTAVPADQLAFADPVAELDVAGWMRSISSSARTLRRLADEAARDVARRVQADTMALYRPQAGESLYGISTRFYGSPHRWRDIAKANHLYQMTLSGEELLVIPAARVS